MYAIILLLCFIVYGIALPIENSDLVSFQYDQYHVDENGMGSYKFSFESNDGIARHEEGQVQNPDSEDAELVVKGAYAFRTPDGVVHSYLYTADKNGFHISEIPVIGSKINTPLLNSLGGGGI
ncbi:PREDICTED: endocuticle structural glycoprotein ABD-5-like [Nicrophorus vespilloides]|uniref:Endocuticle structural glycoprotein ABD-5-like n=1 Tax=Nicrophorus vespilloides TaxID=110193 RepID=A0ABM1NG27_NICVS|nr:PREDICTED: endocuticle structural glycoprotein ABD-5-like [Nicrophorus vespilloides]